MPWLVADDLGPGMGGRNIRARRGREPIDQAIEPAVVDGFEETRCPYRPAPRPRPAGSPAGQAGLGLDPGRSSNEEALERPGDSGSSGSRGRSGPSCDSRSARSAASSPSRFRIGQLNERIRRDRGASEARYSGRGLRDRRRRSWAGAGDVSPSAATAPSWSASQRQHNPGCGRRSRRRRNRRPAIRRPRRPRTRALRRPSPEPARTIRGTLRKRAQVPARDDRGSSPRARSPGLAPDSGESRRHRLASSPESQPASSRCLIAAAGNSARARLEPRNEASDCELPRASDAGGPRGPAETGRRPPGDPPYPGRAASSGSNHPDGRDVSGARGARSRLPAAD